jgi:hypothetical protein
LRGFGSDAIRSSAAARCGRGTVAAFRACTRPSVIVIAPASASTMSTAPASGVSMPTELRSRPASGSRESRNSCSSSVSSIM